MEYTVIFHPAEEGGFGAEVPTLPGCFSQGESFEETMTNIKEAIETHITALKEDGQAVSSDPGILVGRVQVAA